MKLTYNPLTINNFATRLAIPHQKLLDPIEQAPDLDTTSVKIGINVFPVAIDSDIMLFDNRGVGSHPTPKLPESKLKPALGKKDSKSMYKTPDSVLKAQLEQASSTLIEAKGHPLFSKIFAEETDPANEEDLPKDRYFVVQQEGKDEMVLKLNKDNAITGFAIKELSKRWTRAGDFPAEAVKAIEQAEYDAEFA